MKWIQLIGLIFILSFLIQIGSITAEDTPVGVVTSGDQNATPPTTVDIPVNDCCDDYEKCTTDLATCHDYSKVLDDDIRYLNDTLNAKNDIIKEQRAGVYQFFDFLNLRVNIFYKNVTVICFILNITLSFTLAVEFKRLMNIKVRGKNLHERLSRIEKLLHIEQLYAKLKIIESLSKLFQILFNIVQVIVAFIIFFLLLLQICF